MTSGMTAMYSRIQVSSAPALLGIVIPCFNEQEVLPETTRRLEALLDQMVAAGQVAPESRIWYIDDGSRDATWSLIDDLAARTASRVCGIKLSRNRGHQVALLAGLMTAEGDVLISVDADLQDDLDVIPQMVAESKRGCDIVYGVRSTRDADQYTLAFPEQGNDYFRLESVEFKRARC